MNKSFTLIEILVVIVVIGVLSAFILVGMSSITSKANIAKGQAFVNSMDSSLLLARVSQWKIDERTTAGHEDTFIDSWGSNTGTLYTNDGTNNKVSSDCPLGKCLSFDGTDDYVDCGNIVALGNNFTFSAWIKNNLTPVTYSPIITRDGETDGGAIFRINNSNRLALRQYNLQTATANTSISNNIWYSVTVTVYNKVTRFYLNGVSDNSPATFSADFVDVGNIRIGKYTSGGNIFFWDGSIDDVRIYNQAISTSEIQQNYYIGINKLFKNNRIVIKEYNQRLSELRESLSNK